MGAIAFYGLGGLSILLVGFRALQEAVAHFKRSERWRGVQRTIPGVACTLLGIGAIVVAAVRVAHLGH